MIRIPNPCDQSWDAMTLADRGRLCSACEKVVVDFTRMSTLEIIRYFASGQKSCGHFYTHQLARIENYLVIRPEIRRSRWKPAGFSLLLAVSAALTSCSPAEKTVGEITPLARKDTLVKDNDTVAVTGQEGSFVPVSTAKVHSFAPATEVPRPDPPELSGEVVEDVLGGVPVIEQIDTQAVPEVMTDPEEMPQFPGGEQAMLNYLKQHIKYPRGTCAEGRVIVSFIVRKDSTLSEIKVLKDPAPGSGLAEEAVRVISGMPHWSPGKVMGKPVDVKMVLPVKFRLD